MTDVVSQLDPHPKDTWLRRFVAALLMDVRTRRPVCPVCWIPFSDWFVWGCWSYCYPCHDATGYVILEPYGRAAAFRATQEQETQK